MLLLWLKIASAFKTTRSPVFFYADDCWRSFSKIVLMIEAATSRPGVKECISDGRPIPEVFVRRKACVTWRRRGGAEEEARNHKV